VLSARGGLPAAPILAYPSQVELPFRVKTGKAQREHIFSALPPKADIAQPRWRVRFVARTDTDFERAVCIILDINLNDRSGQPMSQLGPEAEVFVYQN
jgi:hypothetical protein